jgi:hypothetical protein
MLERAHRRDRLASFSLWSAGAKVAGYPPFALLSTSTSPQSKKACRVGLTLQEASSGRAHVRTKLCCSAFSIVIRPYMLKVSKRSTKSNESPEAFGNMSFQSVRALKGKAVRI